MSKMMQHIRASLEEAGLVMHEAPAVEVEVFVGEEPTVQDAELELVEAAGEVEEATEAVEVLEKAAATMESIAISIESIVEGGGELAPEVVEQIEERIEEVLEDVGLAPEAAEEIAADAAEAAAECGECGEGEGEAAAEGAEESELIGGDVEGEAEVASVPVVEVIASTESFAADRRTASMESLEKVKDFLHKLWMGIKAAVAKAYEAVSGFFSTLFDATARVTKRIEALRAAAKGIAGKKAKEAIAFRSAGRLAYQGKFNPTAVKEGLVATANVGVKVFGQYVDGVIGTYKATGGDMAGLEAAAKTTEGLNGVAISGDYKFVNSAKAVAIPMLQGPEKVFDNSAAIAPLSAAEIGAVLAAIEKLNGLLASKKEKVKAMKAASDAALVVLDKKLAEADRNVAMKAADRVQLRAKMLLTGRAWTRPVTQFSSHAFGSIRAGLVLVERSIAAYKEEPKAA